MQMKSPEFKRPAKKTPEAVIGDGDKIVVNGQEAFRDRSSESNEFPEGDSGFTSLDKLKS